MPRLLELFIEAVAQQMQIPWSNKFLCNKKALQVIQFPYRHYYQQQYLHERKVDYAGVDGFTLIAEQHLPLLQKRAVVTWGKK